MHESAVSISDDSFLFLPGLLTALQSVYFHEVIAINRIPVFFLSVNLVFHVEIPFSKPLLLTKTSINSENFSSL